MVIAGADKGKRGRIIAVVGKKQRAIVEGAHMIKGTPRTSTIPRARSSSAKAPSTSPM